MKKNNIIKNFWDIHYKKWWEWNRWNKLSSDLRYIYELEYLKKYINKNDIKWNYLEVWIWNWKFFRKISKYFNKSIWIEISDVAVEKNKKEFIGKSNIEIFKTSLLDLDINKYNNYFDFVFIGWVLMFLNENELRLASDILYKITKEWWYIICREPLTIWNKTIINKKEDYIDYIHTINFIKEVFGSNFIIEKIEVNHIFWISWLKILQKIKNNIFLLKISIFFLIIISKIIKKFNPRITDNYFIILRKK